MRLTDIRFHKLKKTHDVSAIARHHGVEISDIWQQLQLGIPVETEHTADRTGARQIALAHLWEKPDYYTVLSKAGL